MKILSQRITANSNETGATGHISATILALFLFPFTSIFAITAVLLSLTIVIMTFCGSTEMRLLWHQGWGIPGTLIVLWGGASAVNIFLSLGWRSFGESIAMFVVSILIMLAGMGLCDMVGYKLEVPESVYYNDSRTQWMITIVDSAIYNNSGDKYKKDFTGTKAQADALANKMVTEIKAQSDRDPATQGKNTKWFKIESVELYAVDKEFAINHGDNERYTWAEDAARMEKSQKESNPAIYAGQN